MELAENMITMMLLGRPASPPPTTSEIPIYHLQTDHLAVPFNLATQSPPTIPTIPRYRPQPQPQPAAGPSVSLSQRPKYTVHISFYEAFSLFGNKKPIASEFTAGVFDKTGFVINEEFTEGCNWLYSNSRQRIVPIPAHIACWDIKTIGKRIPGTQDVLLEFYRKPATRTTQILRLMVLLVLFGIVIGFYIIKGVVEGSQKGKQLADFLATMAYWVLIDYVNELRLPGYPLEHLSWRLSQLALLLTLR